MGDVKKEEPGNERKRRNVARPPVPRERDEDEDGSEEGSESAGGSRHTGDPERRKGVARQD